MLKSPQPADHLATFPPQLQRSVLGLRAQMMRTKTTTQHSLLVYPIHASSQTRISPHTYCRLDQHRSLAHVLNLPTTRHYTSHDSSPPAPFHFDTLQTTLHRKCTCYQFRLWPSTKYPSHGACHSGSIHCIAFGLCGPNNTQPRGACQITNFLCTGPQSRNIFRRRLPLRWGTGAKAQLKSE